MLRLILLIPAFFTVLAGFSQPIRFNKLIKAEPDLTEGGDYIQPLLDGGYLFTSSGFRYSASDSTKFYRIFIVRTDSIGNVKNKVTIGKANYHYGVGFGPAGLVPTKDGHFGFTGYMSDSNYFNGKALLIKIKPTGDTLWMKEYSISGKNLIGSSLVNTPDNGFAIAVFAKIDSANQVTTFILKTDSNGNIQWQKEYLPLPGGNWFDAFQIISMPDYGYCMSGRVSLRIQVIRTDSLGGVIWSREYGVDDSYAFVRYLANNNLVLLGKSNWDAYLSELKLNGDTVYTKNFYRTARMDVFRDFHERADGYVLMGIRDLKTPDSVLHSTGFLFKINPATKAIIWQRTFYRHYYWDNAFKSMKPTPDGGYIITGFAHDSTATKGTADIWLVKTDSFGCDVPGCQLADGLAPLQPGQGASMQLYPNPAATQGPVHVQYLLRKPGQLTVTLTDINGKQLAEIPFYSHATEGSLSMDLGWLKPGIYTLTLQTETGSAHQKLLLQ